MSKPQGVPVSVAKTAKDSLLSSSSGSSSFPIRAPLTVDYDSSDNGFESDGFSDDEVMSDNSCEKPVVATPDDESSGGEEFVVSRTFVKNPDEKIGQEMSGSDVEENVVIKPYVTLQNGKISEKSSSVDVGKYVVSRPFVSIPDRVSTLNRVVSRRFVAVDGESLVSPLVEELDGKVGGGETKKVKVDGKVVGGDVILSLPSPSVPPIAKLSRDSDEDSVGSVFGEDDGISSVDKIPVIETLKNPSAPKAQVMGGGEEDVDEYESQFNSVLKSEVFDGSVSLKLLTGVLGGDEERSGARKDSAKDNVSSSLVNDELPHFPGDAKAICSVESSVSFSSDSSVLDEVADYSVEGIQGLENMEHVADLDETDSINSDHKSAVVDCISITQGETSVDYIESKQVAEGNHIENAGFDDIYISVDSSTVEVVKVVSSKVEIESDNCMTGLATKVVKSVGEKNVSDAQGETVHKPGGDIATECDIIYSVCEENAEVDQNVNVDARSVYNRNCETNGGHVISSELFSGGINYKRADSIMKQETDFLNGQIASSDGGLMKDELCCKSTIYQPDSTGADLGHLEIENNIYVAHKLVQSKEEDKGLCSEGSVEGLKLVEAIVVETVASELELVLSCDSFSGGESFHDHSKMVDEHFVTYSDEDAAVTFSDESEILSLPHSADINSIISPMEPTAQTNHPILSYSTDLDSKKTFPEDEKSKLALECIRLKYLSFVQRLGLSGEDPIVARVLYLLDLAIGRSSNLTFSQETAKRAAFEFEAENKKGSDLSLNILIIGKSGVGKSATINSIFGEERTKIDPFEPATKAVKEILGTINGIKVRVLDTPGLKTSLKDEHLNWKVLKSIAKFTKRCPPDVVIYVDRLDMPSQDDLLLLRSITRSLGSIWHKTFIALTHAASTPPDGASGEPLSFEKFVAVQSQAIRQLISLAIDDQNMVNAGLVNPVCLVENQGYCEAWKPQLLLLCCSAKILSELNFTIGGAYETLDVNHLLDFIVPSPPLSYLSSLLQSNNHLELSADQGVENLNSEIEVENGLDFAGSSRAIISQVNAAYKTSFEVRFKESQHLVQQDQTTMIMLLKQQRGDFAWACNIRSQFSIRRNTKMAVHAVMNNKESGQVSVRVSISDHFQIALVVLLPIVRRIFRKFFPRLERDD